MGSLCRRRTGSIERDAKRLEPLNLVLGDSLRATQFIRCISGFNFVFVRLLLAAKPRIKFKVILA